MKKMVLNFMRMRENLDPMDFYHGMRPYLAGRWVIISESFQLILVISVTTFLFSYNNPGLPNGLIYEGISTEGKKFIGGSAAQVRSEIFSMSHNLWRHKKSNFQSKKVLHGTFFGRSDSGGSPETNNWLQLWLLRCMIRTKITKF